MDVRIISTGSIGNFNVIDDVIVIDCGVSKKMFLENAPNAEHILISHEHGDHMNTIIFNHLLRTRPLTVKRGLHVNASSLEKIRKHNKATAEAITHIIDGNTEMDLKTSKGVYHLRTYPLFHDVENQGFIITSPNGETLIHATDTMTMDGAPKNEKYDYLMIEGNWDEDTLVESLTHPDKNVRFRAQRNLRHMSVQLCHKFMIDHCKPTSKCYQLHQSSVFGTKIEFSPENIMEV